MMNAEDTKLVFGLDIGTRSIVGTVGYRIGTDRFVVVAQESIEHTTRAVIDGQIHDIPTVADTIYKVKERLEKRVREPLSDVSIAAAGRVLKTKRVKARYQFSSETKVTEDHIRSLDMMGVEQAYDEIRKEQTDSGKKFFCVGYSIVKYYLNGYPMEMIEMHMANYIEVELIATFLPEEVVDGLYSAVELAGLHVASLTLEPIAAINMAIPEKFRLLNIALVDVGAGTSDISIVKDGSIIAFGMIPLAGDEVTESIAKKYLTDFETAEYIKRACERKKSVSFKDIFGSKIQVTKEDIAQISEDAVKNITKNIADRILELNGGQCVSAVFVVGGGGRIHGFTDSLAEYLSISKERVAVRGEEVLHDVRFRDDITITKDSLIVTPIGICISYYLQTNNFIFVNFNGKRIKMYNNNRLNVVSVALMAGFPNSSLFPKRGKELVYYVDGQKRMLRGEIGDSCIITLNGKPADINSEVSANDKIVIKESTSGKDAELTLAKLPEIKGTINIIINGKEVPCPKLVAVNGELKSEYYSIQNNDKIEFLKSYSLKQLIEYADLNPKMNTVRVNNEEASEYTTVYENFTVTYESMTEENGDEY